ncbi:MAG: YdcF family protein [Chlorobi bacterium]|nr:YdcF family protein [Chlorobiota bacterium]
MDIKRLKNIQILKLLKYLFLLLGSFFALILIIAFTTLPYWGLHWLGTSKAGLKWEPGTIILLGGGGMPSESNLIRSWYVAKAAAQFPGCKVVVAMPGDISDTLSTPVKMKDELVLRGVNPDNIIYENEGRNTRAQAINCGNILLKSKPILLVTSPEHTRRSVLCFSKVGFEKVDAIPAFENATEADLTFDDDKLGGNTTFAPDVGESISLRYQVWNHLKYEILIAREFMALAYYRIRGWV